MEEAVERAVTVMRARYHERLSVADLAAEAFFSPFHFSRVFRRELGVSPVQYLTAVRLFEAKRLLHATSLNVADIACRVGYCGIGTFTTRFTAMVGVSPGHYRRLPPSRMLAIADGYRQLPRWDALPNTGAAVHAPADIAASLAALAGSGSGSVSGSGAGRPGAGRGRRGAAERSSARGGSLAGSVPVAAAAGRLFVGVFPDPIPQGPPVAWTLATGADCGRWRLDGVPTGRWALIAVLEGGPAETPTAGTGAGAGAGSGSEAFRVGVHPAVQVIQGTPATVELRMRRPHHTDPPILIPLCHCVPEPERVAS